MKKTIAMVMAALLMVTMLAGCGAGGNDKNEQGQTVISVGGWETKEGTALDNQNARKERFEEVNPDIAIEPDTWKFDRKTYYAKAAGGQLPMVYNAGVTEIVEIMNSGYSADLADVLKERGYADKFNPKVIDIVSKDGGIYAIPKFATVMGLMFNAELYEAAGLIGEDGLPKQPETWFEVVEFAKKIKEATGKAGFVIPTANGSGGWLFTALAWSFGVDFMEKDENGKWKATFNTPEAAEALQFIKDMKWEHDILPANTLIDGAEWQKVFGTGNAGITFGAGEYPASTLWKYDMKADNIGLLAMPAGPKDHVTLLSCDILCVSDAATKDQVEAGVRWIETEVNPVMTEDVKKTMIDKYQLYAENGQPIGVKGISVWQDDVEAVQFERDLIDQMCNMNPNYVKLYNDFAANCPIEIRPEEPVCCQELYRVLDSCMQEVLTNKDADCVAVLEKANADFQSNYLDNM